MQVEGHSSDLLLCLFFSFYPLLDPVLSKNPYGEDLPSNQLEYLNI